MDVTTALTLVISPEYHDHINLIRSQYDRAYPRWPPHINFLFPFVSKDQFPDLAKRLEEKLKGFGAFNLEFQEIDYFKQGKNLTYHLKPKDDTKLQELSAIIMKTLAEMKMKHEKFQPHLTLGQSTKAEFDKLSPDFQKWLGKGFTIKVDKISFLTRSKTDNTEPFTTDRDVHL
ncbi:MAG: hypothetical protein Hyperionvirus25_24 [Hyperionvirus sp.]|uniref:2'-5' RNA ligase family protein n=1 Tax=Hyperionvirus sp. TaxID=2487770 RepID=A0A3G5AB21_9VIRU|nr:MAG: hypothetical protein Hyperionvirus25_24 [Hyperionvirus sp.]